MCECASPTQTMFQLRTCGVPTKVRAKEWFSPSIFASPKSTSFTVGTRLTAALPLVLVLVLPPLLADAAAAALEGVGVSYCSMMFSGLMSRWMMPWSCRNANASNTWLTHTHTRQRE